MRPGDSVHAPWITADALLEEAEAKLHRVVFQTWCTIGRGEQRDRIGWICINEGIGYPTTARLAGDDVRH